MTLEMISSSLMARYMASRTRLSTMGFFPVGETRGNLESLLGDSTQDGFR